MRTDKLMHTSSPAPASTPFDGAGCLYVCTAESRAYEADKTPKNIIIPRLLLITRYMFY